MPTPTALLIKNATLVTARARVLGDVACADGRIQAIGPNLAPAPDATVIDARDKFVLPGGVDAHTHMELPVGDFASVDDFETGTAAAAAGGTTTIIDFISPNRGESLLATRDLWRRKAEKACIDYGLHMAVTWYSGDVARQMREVCLNDGVTSFKVYLAYLESIGVGDADVARIMRVAAELGALVTVHAENGIAVRELQMRLVAEGKTAPKYHAESRPPWVEGEAVHRAITLARVFALPLYVVHVSSRDGLAEIERARQASLPVLAETCPQYLLLDERAYERRGFEGAAFVMSPPLRAHEHQEALWRGLTEGLIQTVATDHCPFRMADQKVRGRHDFTLIPNGAGGVEDRLRLLYTYGVKGGRLTLEQLVDCFATRPAKIFGLYPEKGELAVGSDADLVIYDPDGEFIVSHKTQWQRADHNIYEGLVVRGRVDCTIACGRVVFANGRLQTRSGAGRYLPRRLPDVGARV